MARVSYGRGPCRICGQEVSGNGLGSSSHNMKHVREGALVRIESRIYDYDKDRYDYFRYFVTPAEARRRLDRAEQAGYEMTVIAGEPAPKGTDA